MASTFYTTGMEHSPTSATGTRLERTPWARDACGATSADASPPAPTVLSIRVGALGAPSDMLREQIVDEGLVTQPSSLGLPPHGVEDLRIDADRDQSPGLSPQGRPPNASHRSKLGWGSLRNVGEVNPWTPPQTPPAPSGSPGAR